MEYMETAPAEYTIYTDVEGEDEMFIPTPADLPRTCCNCKYWGKAKLDGVKRTCTRNMSNRDGGFIYSEFDMDEGALFTGGEFGCTLWEGKEEA